MTDHHPAGRPLRLLIGAAVASLLAAPTAPAGDGPPPLVAPSGAAFLERTWPEHP